MFTDRCPEPLDLPSGLAGDQARSAYQFMLKQLGQPLALAGNCRLENDYQISQEMRRRYTLSGYTAANIAYLAIRDMTEIQNL